MNRSEIPLILASASPRRRDLLQAAGFRPQIRIPAVDETPLKGETARALVERLAVEKAKSVSSEEAVIIAGDTVVQRDGEILGKPSSPKEAVRMLESLSGRSHQIIGGWCVRKGRQLCHGVEVCEVEFRTLESSEISEYVHSGEPMDKAGAYAIQGGAGRFVTAFKGYWSNAIGLPLIPVTFTTEHLFIDGNI